MRINFRKTSIFLAFFMVLFLTSCKSDIKPEFKGNIELSNISVDSFSYSYSIKEGESYYNFQSAELLQNDEIILTTIDSNNTIFNDLKSNTIYTLKITFKVNDDTLGINEYEYLSRNVQTLRIAKPNIFVKNVDVEYHSIRFELNFTNESLIKNEVEVSLFKADDDELIKTMVYEDDIYFEELFSNTKYKVIIKYSYDLNDGAGIINNEYIYSFTTLKYQVPTIIVSDYIVDVSSIGFSVSFGEEEVFYNKIDSINIYENDKLINTVTDSYEVVFENLISNTLYEIVINYSYDLNDGNGLIEGKISDKVLTNANSIDILDLKIISAGNNEVGNTIVLNIEIENIDQLEITIIYVDDIPVEVFDIGSDTITISYVPNFFGGTYNPYVTGFEYYSLLGSKYIKINSNVTDSIFLYGELDVMSIYEEEQRDFISIDADNYLIIQLENYTGYDIMSLSLKIDNHDYKYNQSEIVVIDKDLIKVKYKHVLDSYNYKFYTTIEVVGISYGIQNYKTKTKRIDDVSNLLYVSHSSQLKDINTIEQLQNMRDGYIYVIRNDIDASGFNWTPYKFTGLLYGNGHIIKNLTLNITSDYFDKNIGLFTEFEGLIHYLNFDNITIKASIKDRTSLGLVAGSLLEHSAIEHINITNSLLDFKSSSNGYVGGIVGTNYGYVTDSNINNSVIMTNSTNGNIGGLIGYANNGHVYRNNLEDVEMKIVSSYGLLTVGGMIGGNNGSSIIYNSVKNLDMDVSADNSVSIGGFIGGDYDGKIKPYDAYNSVDTFNLKLVNIADRASLSGSTVGGYISTSAHTIQNSYVNNINFDLKVNKNADVGGFAGYTTSSSKIDRVFVNNANIEVFTKEPATTVYVGGITGLHYYGGVIQNSLIMNLNVNVDKFYSANVSEIDGAVNTQGRYNNYIELSNILLMANNKKVSYDGNNNTVSYNRVNDSDFYTDTLMWSDRNWNLDNLDIANGIIPRFAWQE